MESRSFLRRLSGATQGITSPVDYSSRTTYRRPPALYRHLQWLGVLLTSYGLGPPYAVTLEVRGRRSGKPRRTVLVRTASEGSDYLVALSGESEWVRNVRAARGQAVIRRGPPQKVILKEVPIKERPPVIQAYLHKGGRLSNPDREARYYFGLGLDPTPREIRRVAGHYPVFQIVAMAGSSPMELRKARPTAFFLSASTLSIFFVVLFVGLTIFTVASWAAGRDTMTNPVTDLGFFALGGVIVGSGLVVQLRSPERHIAGLQQVLIALLALTVAGLLGGREEPFWGGLLFFMFAIVLTALHPAREELLKFSGGVSVPLALLSAASAFPAVIYAASMLRAARSAGTSCFLGRCAHGDRFAEQAAVAIAIVLIAMLASLKARGWIVCALSAGASAFILGAASIVLPNVEGSLAQVWGAIAVAWGLAILAVAGWEVRESSHAARVSFR